MSERQKLIEISTSGWSPEKWEANRREMITIGGSDAPPIVGLDDFKTPYTLWAEKSGLIVPEDISKKEAVRIGNDLEDYVARRFTEATGKKVIRKNAILKNPDFPWAHANVDRLVVGEDAGLEIKTTSALSTKHFKGGDYPARYYVQCMHYLAITGRQKWYLAVLVLGREFLVFEIERDEEEIAALMDAEKRFWGHVQEGTAPEMSGEESDTEALQTIYPESSGETVDLFGMDSTLEHMASLDEQIKSLTKERDAIKQSIQGMMGSADYGITDNWKVSWKSQSRTTIDTKTLSKDHPEIVAQYGKTSTSRVFRTSRMGV